MAAISIDRTAEVAREGYDYTTRAVKIAKKSIKVAVAFGSTMAELSDVITAFKAFKIIKAFSAFRDLSRNTIKLIKPGDLTKKFFATIGLLKAVKKIVGAVGVIFTYLNKFNLISASSLAWTTIAGFVFMPLNFISAGISGYQFVEKVNFQKTFRRDLSQAKKAGASTLVKHMIAHEPKLRKMRVLSKDSGLNYRLNGILTKLKSSNAEIRQKAKDESLFIKKRLKDRLREQVGVAGVSTSLSVGGVASTVVGLACPPAAPALAAVGLGLGVVGVANTIYSKFIPKGDIFETEKRMFFSHVVKGVEKLVDRFRPAAAAA